MDLASSEGDKQATVLSVNSLPSISVCHTWWQLSVSCAASPVSLSLAYFLCIKLCWVFFVALCLLDYYQAHHKAESSQKRIMAVKHGQCLVHNSAFFNTDKCLLELMNSMTDNKVKETVLADEHIWTVTRWSYAWEFQHWQPWTTRFLSFTLCYFAFLPSYWMKISKITNNALTVTLCTEDECSRSKRRSTKCVVSQWQMST